MIEIVLTAPQLQHAAAIARSRQREAERQGLEGQHGGHTRGPHARRDHYLGMVGEVAVAAFLGHPTPDTVNTFKAPDLPGRIQVRTRSKHSYELIVRPGDDDDDYFVHATTEDNMRVRMHGWILGREAKQFYRLRSHGGRAPAYFVPVTDLHQLSDLITWIIDDGSQIEYTEGE